MRTVLGLLCGFLFMSGCAAHQGTVPPMRGGAAAPTEFTPATIRRAAKIMARRGPLTTIPHVGDVLPGAIGAILRGSDRSAFERIGTHTLSLDANAIQKVVAVVDPAKTTQTIRRTHFVSQMCWYQVTVVTYWPSGYQVITGIRFLGCDPPEGIGDDSPGDLGINCAAVGAALARGDAQALADFLAATGAALDLGSGTPGDNFGGEATQKVYDFSKTVKDNPVKRSNPNQSQNTVGDRLYDHAVDFFGKTADRLSAKERLFYDLDIKYFAAAIGSSSPGYAGTRNFVDGNGVEHSRELYITKTQDIVDQANANGLKVTVDPSQQPYLIVFFDRNTNTWIAAYPANTNVAKSILGTEKAKGLSTGNFTQVAENDPAYDVTSPENTDYAALYEAMIANELASQGC